MANSHPSRKLLNPSLDRLAPILAPEGYQNAPRSGRPGASPDEDLMAHPSHSHGGQGRLTLRDIPHLTAVAFVLACNGDTGPPTAPEFAKGGFPTPTVTSLADDVSPQPGTLRYAIIMSRQGSNVTFADNLCPPGGHCTITLQAPLEIGAHQIIGPTGYTLAVDGGGSVGPVLHVMGDAVVKNLTITGGGGLAATAGISARFGTLLLTNVTVTGNGGSNNAFGGIFILNGTTVILTNSTVSGNTGTYVGGIFNPGGTLTLTNSTVSGNTSSGLGVDSPRGGGIVGDGSIGSSITTLKNACVNNNTMGSTSSAEPWSTINITLAEGATVTGLNCGVARP